MSELWYILRGEQIPDFKQPKADADLHPSALISSEHVDKLKALAADPHALGHKIMEAFAGAVIATQVIIGHRLGLYTLVSSLQAPTSVVNIAKKAGLHERWVREWIYGQAANGFISFEMKDGLEHFSMTPTQTAVVGGMAPVFEFAPGQYQNLDKLPQCFKTGKGLTYDDHGPDIGPAIEVMNRSWVEENIESIVSQLGLTEKLKRGAKVVDVGCGGAAMLCCLAKKFPRSNFIGYDTSKFALELAQKNIAASEAKNIRVELASAPPPLGDADFAIVFDALHDMAYPSKCCKEIRKALKDDGVFMIADIKAKKTLTENCRNPLSAMQYGFSVNVCMSSGLSEEGGEALGTLGLYPEKLEEMVRAAGFRSFKMMNVEHPAHFFYDVRA